MWAWTVAGDAGRAAVGWYELVPVAGTSNFDIHVHVAVTQNGRGSTFKCPDGTTVQVPPQFSETDASGRPIYTGPKPCSGIMATDSSPKLVEHPMATSPDMQVVRDAEAGRDLLPATGQRCSDARVPTATCEQPDTTIEPSIAVNPENPLNAVAVYQEGRVDGGGDGANGYATTFDGGKTWTYGDLPGLTKETGGTWQRGSDAVVAFGPHNVVYAQSLVFADGTIAPSAITVNVSHDGGKTWGPVEYVDNQAEISLNDKNWIGVDMGQGAGHHYGRVYSVWDRVAPVLASYSDDEGVTWTPPFVVYPGQGIGSLPIVLPNGDFGVVFDTLAYALPQIGNPDELQAEAASASDRLVFAVSHGAGSLPTGAPLQFAAPTTVATYDGNGVANQRAGTLPSAAIDPVTGRLYVAWESGRYRTDNVNDIVITASDDGGTTWGPIVRVNPGPTGDGVDHYNAMVDVGSDGQVRVGYRQRDGDDLIDTMFQQSFDHGLTFSAPLQVNTVVRTDPAWGAYSRGGLFSGDYNQLAAAGPYTYIVRCESYEPSAAERLSNRYHQTTWVTVVGPKGAPAL
jgi:hypothetical protein